MKYFSTTERENYLFSPSYRSMAENYWGASPLPQGAKIIGGFSDNRRAGALIELDSGNWVCGNAGAVSNVKKPTYAEYIKLRGLKDARTFATLISGIENDTSLERKLLRWYETNREMLDCLITGAIERSK